MPSNIEVPWMKTYVLQENLEDTTSLFVDQAGDTFYTTATRETTNSWLGNTYSSIRTHSREEQRNLPHTLNVIPKNLTMALGTTLSEAL